MFWNRCDQTNLPPKKESSQAAHPTAAKTA